MSDMIETVKAFLDESEFKYEYREDISCFNFGLTVENGKVQVHIVVKEEEEYFMCYVIWEGNLPKRKLNVVFPILNDINYNTKFTTIGVDTQDGELSCHCGLNTDDATLSVKQVGICLQLAVKTLDDNIERIMRAVWSAPANSDGHYN